MRAFADIFNSLDDQDRRDLAEFLRAGDDLLLRWDDEKVSLAKAQRLGNADPTFEKITDNGAGSIGVYAAAFSNLQNQEVFFDVQLSHKFSEGTDVKPHIHWLPKSAAAGDVVFQFEYLIINKGVPITGTVVEEVVVAAPGAIQEEITPLATIPGTELRASTIIMCGFRRLGNDGRDTYEDLIFGLSVDAHRQESRRGTEEEYPGAGV